MIYTSESREIASCFFAGAQFAKTVNVHNQNTNTVANPGYVQDAAHRRGSKITPEGIIYSEHRVNIFTEQIQRSRCFVVMPEVENVVIVGSGPAAHTAAIYLSRAELRPLMFEGFLAAGVAAGGQLTTTTDVENFPGFPDGISGPGITDLFRRQSERFGTRILTETVTSIDMSKRPFVVTGEDGTVVSAQSIVLATGATARRMDIPGCGEKPGEYWQRGVSGAFVCDFSAHCPQLNALHGNSTDACLICYVLSYVRSKHVLCAMVPRRCLRTRCLSL